MSIHFSYVMNMLTILSITAPIFLLILIGFIVVRTGALPAASIPGMSSYLLFLALPCLIFQKISQLDISQVVNADYLLIYTMGCLLVFFAVFFISRIVLRDSISFAALKGFGGSFPNSALIGLSLMMQYFEHPPTQAFVMVMLVENIVLFPIAFALMETTPESGADLKKTICTVGVRLLKNPIIIAVVTGALASLVHFNPPAFIARVMDLLASSVAPVALVIIGGSLVGSQVRASARDLLLISGFKLVLHPLLVLFMVVFLVPDMDSSLKLAAVIFAASPMMSMYPVIGGQYGQQAYCAGLLLVTTVFGFFSISLMLSLLSLI